MPKLNDIFDLSTQEHHRVAESATLTDGWVGLVHGRFGDAYGGWPIKARTYLSSVSATLFFPARVNSGELMLRLRVFAMAPLCPWAASLSSIAFRAFRSVYCAWSSRFAIRAHS